MKHYRLLLLIILCVLMGCKKDMPSKNLPPVTQEGRNTAGFLLDGEVWVPFAECGLFRSCEEIDVPYGGPPFNNNYLSIHLEREVKEIIRQL